MHVSVGAYNLDNLFVMFFLILFTTSFEGKMSSIVWLVGSQINR